MSHVIVALALFAITIDNEVLNLPAPSSLLENGPSDDDILAPRVKTTVVTANEEKKKIGHRKKKSSSQVISFDDDEIKATLTKNNVIKHASCNVVDKKELERKVQAALKNHDHYRSPSPSMSITYDDVHLESNKGKCHIDK